MKIRLIAAGLLVATALSSLSHAQAPERRRLGILGGLAGAAAGAAIGEDGGDAVPGALIGGAIGLVTGAGLGSAIDADNQRNQAYAAAAAQQRAQAVTMADVVSMTHAGLGDAVIVSHIRAHGVACQPTASDLIVLKQQGVSDTVLSAMQSIPAPAPTIIQAPAPRPVVVQEYYYTHPRAAVWYPPHHHHYHGPRHPGVSWGISFGN